MIGNFITFSLLIALSFWIARSLSERYTFIKFSVLRNLIGYHILLTVAYYSYALFNPSDSWNYYKLIEKDYYGPSWSDYYGVSTIFIEFVGYPFIKFFGLSYEGVTMIFSWFGLLGFFYFYIVLREKIKFKHKMFGVDLLLLILFLPNLHFWSASFGKGSIIFLGMSLFFYGITKVHRRFIAIIIGGIIIYHVRPHILFIVLVATMIGFTFSTRGVSWAVRILVIFFAVIAFNYIYKDVFQLIGIDQEEVFSEGTELTKRAKFLTRANSGVDISNYNFPMKLFTFLFRPLFIDSPGILGIIVSFENLFYLLLFFKILRLDFFSFLWKADYSIKAAFIAFFGVSAALAQIAANLGLAMRQKSQIMILMLFVIITYLDEQKLLLWKTLRERKKRLERRKPAMVNNL